MYILKTGIPDLRFKGRRAWKGQGEWQRERREAGRWKATGIAHPQISA